MKEFFSRVVCVYVQGAGGSRCNEKYLLEVEKLKMILPSDEGFRLYLTHGPGK